jgi:DNA-binding response OmpR family regulator
LRQAAQIGRQPELYLEDFAIGPFLFSAAERKLMQEGSDDIALTDRECNILAYLARHAGQAVTRDTLLKNVWRYQDGIDTHTLETHIYRLRQKMEQSADDPKILLTAAGGYSLKLQ